MRVWLSAAAMIATMGCLSAGDDEPPPTPNPLAITRAASAFDSQRGQMLLFGGTDEQGFAQRTTWGWTPAGWEHLSNTGPAPRYRTAMAYDPVRDRTVLFGGRVSPSAGEGECNETWEWDGSSWTQIPIEGGPACRRAHAMTYDPLRQMVVMYGGFPNNGCINGTCQELWGYNGSWELLKRP